MTAPARRPVGATPRARAEDLLLRGHAAGLCAELLAAGPAGQAQELRSELERLGLPVPDPEAVARAAKLLQRGIIPPYETSYEAGRAPGGMTFQMADIAGFYRAFGFEASGERPDHIVPQVEFLALLFVKEAYAWLAGDAEGADVCSVARRKFAAEHLGAWLPELAERAHETQGGEPIAALAQALAGLIAGAS